MDMEQKSFADGELIFKEGDTGELAILAATGTVDIFRVLDCSSALMNSLVRNLISHIRSLMEQLEAVGEAEDEAPRQSSATFDHETYTRRD